MTSPDQVVYELELENTGTVRTCVCEFRGRRRFRLWIEPRADRGSPLIPTPKGICVPVKYPDELLEVVQALVAAVHPAH